MLGRRQLLGLVLLPVGCGHTRGQPPEPEYVGLAGGYVDEGLAAEMRRVPITMYMTDW